MRILYFSQLTQEMANITNRRSGLFGLSFVGMAIYQKLRVSALKVFISCAYIIQQNDKLLHEAVVKFLDDMIAPIVHCLQPDQDPKVQIAACDAIFNITKCYREEVLKNRHFDAIFNNIITLIGSGDS